MNYQRIKEAIFLSRPNRFIAHAIIDGVNQTAHVKNTGRCRELLYEGVKVFLEDHGTGKMSRKTRYSLVAVEKKKSGKDYGFRLVNIDSHAPNKIVGEALANGRLALPGLKYPLTRTKPEMTYGSSRFDFYVEDGEGNKAFVEVKGVTLEDGGIARFPDAPT